LISQSSLSETAPSPPTAPAPDPTDPFSFVSESALLELEEGLKHHRNELLQVRWVRQVLARERAKHLLAHGELRQVEQAGQYVAFNTIDYNIEGARTAADLDRPMIMTNVVSAIDRVRQKIEKIEVLSVGPRSEIEIFGMMAAGFSKDRIKAVDLFSYSPYVDVGDMHALPYPDNGFDVVMLGWVLSYSRNQSRVVEEVLRVCRDRAIVVLAGDYSDETRDLPMFRNEVTFMQSCDQLLALFSGHVGRIYFRHDPEPPNVWMVMTAFEVRKP
jgi:hypothetical protein